MGIGSYLAEATAEVDRQLRDSNAPRRAGRFGFLSDLEHLHQLHCQVEVAC